MDGVSQIQAKSDIGFDFAAGLRAILRHDPDIIMIGEIRDRETAEIAIRSSLTGHLVFATLHTRDAAQTIDRIVDVFPPSQQQQIRLQLSNALRGIISQQLITNRQGNRRELAYEVLVGTPAIGNLIRESKTHQIYSMIQTGGKLGMRTMDSVLKELFEKGRISLNEYKRRVRTISVSDE